MALAQCRWRSDPDLSGLVTCSSTTVVCDRPFPPHVFCRLCRHVDHEPEPPKPKLPPCALLGKETRRIECAECTKEVSGKPVKRSLKVFSCEVHGECTIGKRADGVKGCCASDKNGIGPCRDYLPKTGTVIVPQPPALSLSPRSNRAVVTIATGDEGRRLLAVSEPYMRHFAARVGADFHILDWPGHPEWPMSAKFAIPRVLDHYQRIVYVDADVLLRPGCLNLFDLCDPDEFGACDELPFHQARPQFRREKAYQNFRKKMGFADVLNLPWYFNAGVMVVPREAQALLLPPKRPIPKEHCAEQDHTNAQILDAYLRGEIRVRLLDRRANWQSWQDWGFRAAPRDAILHWSGG